MRYFQRPGDGIVFAMLTPEHIVRLLSEGWRELPGPTTELPPPPKLLTAEDIAAQAAVTTAAEGIPPPVAGIIGVTSTAPGATQAAARRAADMPDDEELAAFRAWRAARQAESSVPAPVSVGETSTADHRANRQK